MRYMILAGVVLLAGCAGLGRQGPEPPTPAEIVQMAKSGMPAEAIIERMKAADAVYRLPASELARLREQGVPDAVIDYMQLTYIEDVRYREWARMHAIPPFGYWPGPPFGMLRPWPAPWWW